MVTLSAFFNTLELTASGTFGCSWHSSFCFFQNNHLWSNKDFFL